jgi:hypothetical protein
MSSSTSLSGAFHGTGLDGMLRERGIETIIIYQQAMPPAPVEHLPIMPTLADLARFACRTA